VIIDCVGAKTVLPQILELAGKTTTVVIVGNYSEPVLIDVAKIQRNELDVFGNITYTAADFQQAVDLMVSGKVYTEGFITGRFKINQVQEMMDYSLKNRGINVKTIMDF
jgi:threonine dehydrogenase-like Zn-dependent dehydrogenase